MVALEVAGLVVLGAVLGVWLSRAVTVYSAKGRGPVLSRDSHFDVADQGLVSVIVPAKDEEANIGAALETLLGQDYPNLEVIVVDDRSTDGTAEVVRGVAARDGRVRLVQVKELAAGWFGKPHAMHTGAREARGEWLLFVDADCRQRAARCSASGRCWRCTGSGRTRSSPSRVRCWCRGSGRDG
jgi:cellulose synthase/poly-beta-1,6-N-acetylglucosamine synthase-like glycosyltransferase